MLLAAAVAVAVLLGHGTARRVGLRPYNYYCCYTSSMCLCAFQCCCGMMIICPYLTLAWGNVVAIEDSRGVEPTQTGELGLTPRAIARSVSRRHRACRSLHLGL